ncbi:MAG: hypothetical protein WCE90_10785 [Candidatus Zixiibacteriota bacterium]
MQSILILALTLMGWMGNPNMGGPERLALSYGGGGTYYHQASLSVSQNSGGPERLLLDSDHGKNLRPDDRFGISIPIKD